MSLRDIFAPSVKDYWDETIIIPIENHPSGYPRLAALLDNDENFMLYRKFGFV
ncbi:hypothetical protein BJ875DRAFT_481744 [Amylocarpus encephaloides]|uniref:Uncharacterized protein n=1 Tax=Amylocarpus encephaloides TaxID=45428 RepID=A0A9P7YNC5_9HELO|nr:hypothetical protein BJ875DRAFT_481744 [Amylocarpus encephaloides]